MAIKLKNKKARRFLIFLCVVTALTTTFIALKLAGERLYYITSNTYYETKDFKQTYVELSADVLEEILNEKDQDEVDGSLPSDEHFLYLLSIEGTAQTFTNIESDNPLKEILQYPTVILWDKSGIKYLGKSELRDVGIESYANSDIADLLKTNKYKYYTAIPNSLDENIYFKESFHQYNSYINEARDNLQSIITCTVVIAICLLCLTLLIVGNRQVNSNSGGLFKKIPIEFLVLLAMILFYPLAETIDRIRQQENVINSFVLLGLFFAGIGILIFADFLIIFRDSQWMKMTLVGRLSKELQILLGFRGWYVFVFILALSVNISLLYSMTKAFYVALFLLILFDGLLFKRYIGHLNSLYCIMDTVHKRTYLDDEISIDESKLTPAFREFGKEINTIQSALQNAIMEAVKGEKMKTELITNVTHDLKNPLTSIVNYIDLLKMEASQNPEIRNEKEIAYIEILEEKSKRLKLLIEQLVEAAKVTSGNLPVNIESIDLYQLMLQIQGEFAEDMEKAGLELIVEKSESMLIDTDSKHLWRLFENLLSNVVKYAMSGTRVYITFTQTQSNAMVAIKNISANQLNLSMEELTERFVRGDSSRNTEGSGLGLSIATSLAKLINADIDFTIDGDLFKATVSLPKTQSIEG